MCPKKISQTQKSHHAYSILLFFILILISHSESCWCKRKKLFSLKFLTLKKCTHSFTLHNYTWHPAHCYTKSIKKNHKQNSNIKKIYNFFSAFLFVKKKIFSVIDFKWLLDNGKKLIKMWSSFCLVEEKINFVDDFLGGKEKNFKKKF